MQVVRALLDVGLISITKPWLQQSAAKLFRAANVSEVVGAVVAAPTGADTSVRGSKASMHTILAWAFCIECGSIR
jgi:hypothetical protein